MVADSQEGNMARIRVLSLVLAGILWLAAVPKTQERPEPIPPGQVQANDATRRFEKDMHRDRPQPAVPQPAWEKARADAARLLTLAQEIQGQLQAGPQQVPAHLAGDLKEVDKLVKRLRRELLF
jgi:hypothetical protein